MKIDILVKFINNVIRYFSHNVEKIGKYINENFILSNLKKKIEMSS